MTIFSLPVVPVIHAGISEVTVTEGDMAVLDCNATGNPPPIVSWFHSSLPVPEPDDPRVSQAANDSLIVEEVEEGDGGEYVCQAVNEAGTETAQLQLVVNGKVASFFYISLFCLLIYPHNFLLILHALTYISSFLPTSLPFFLFSLHLSHPSTMFSHLCLSCSPTNSTGDLHHGSGGFRGHAVLFGHRSPHPDCHLAT